MQQLEDIKSPDQALKPLEVLQYPAEILRQRAVEIETIDDKIVLLAGMMFATMKHMKGIGLAAPQVGVGVRLIVGEVEGARFALVNPVIVKRSEQTTVMNEGCLSFRGCAYVPVRRPKQIVVAGLTLRNQPIKIKARGLLATCLQHEIDHLDGVTLADYKPVPPPVDKSEMSGEEMERLTTAAMLDLKTRRYRQS